MNIFLNQNWIKNGALATEVCISLSTWVHEKTSLAFAAMGALENLEFRFIPTDRDFSISIGGSKICPTAYTLPKEKSIRSTKQILKPALRKLNCCLRL